MNWDDDVIIFIKLFPHNKSNNAFTYHFFTKENLNFPNQKSKIYASKTTLVYLKISFQKLIQNKWTSGLFSTSLCFFLQRSKLYLLDTRTLTLLMTKLDTKTGFKDRIQYLAFMIKSGTC